MCQRRGGNTDSFEVGYLTECSPIQRVSGSTPAGHTTFSLNRYPDWFPPSLSVPDRRLGARVPQGRPYPPQSPCWPMDSRKARFVQNDALHRQIPPEAKRTGF